MKIIKKFTAINLGKKRIGDGLAVTGVYGDMQFDGYGGQWNPDTEFDTEEEAIAHAYKHNPYGTWAIIPIITFDNEV